VDVTSLNLLFQNFVVISLVRGKKNATRDLDIATQQLLRILARDGRQPVCPGAHREADQVHQQEQVDEILGNGECAGRPIWS
jgi:hypothetical protein